MHSILSVISFGLFGLSLVAFAPEAASNIPDNLAVPEGNALFLSLIGEGVQIYHCEESAEAAGTYQWAFTGPYAHLYNEAYDTLGIHYAGPVWEANDGSLVVGEVIERADSPGDGVPWLLLRAASAKGNGLFSRVSFIQRIDTAGGKSPAAETCNEQQAGTFARIPYTTMYLFYTEAPVNLTPANVPDNLQVSEGNTMAFQLVGDGVQIYRCQESAETAGTFAWTFSGPEADLLNDAGERVGLHYSGPMWESSDGSLVVGEVVERADSPDGAVPWLLLRALSTQGNGKLGSITFIQRLDTVGGTAPAADTCTAERSQTIVRVPYSALYVFYVAD